MILADENICGIINWIFMSQHLAQVRVFRCYISVFDKELLIEEFNSLLIIACLHGEISSCDVLPGFSSLSRWKGPRSDAAENSWKFHRFWLQGWQALFLMISMRSQSFVGSLFDFESDLGF